MTTIADDLRAAADVYERNAMLLWPESEPQKWGLANAARLRQHAETVERVEQALRMAVRQNEHDMLMTGEELRQCHDALRGDKP